MLRLIMDTPRGRIEHILQDMTMEEAEEFFINAAKDNLSYLSLKGYNGKGILYIGTKLLAESTYWVEEIEE